MLGLGGAVTSTAAPAPAVATPSAPRLFKWYGGEGPRDSEDLARVLALPRRELALSPSLTASVSARYTRAGCGDPTCAYAGGLRPIQASALDEAERVGGLLGLIGVGWGKTILSLCLPVALGGRNAVLLVPPALRDQLDREADHLAQHFRTANRAFGRWSWPDVSTTLHVVSYSELSSPTRSDILDRLKPDVIVADEAHALRHSSASRTKRFKRYAREHPGTRFAFMSGTLTTRSITDYAHLAGLALGEGAPVPLDWATLEEWAFALDAGPNTEAFPPPAGALLRLCDPGESPRAGFRRRLIQTPGVVATVSSGDCDATLILAPRSPEVPAAITEAVEAMRASWKTPSGEELTDDLHFSRAQRQLAAGFFYRWVWPGGIIDREWLAARAAWHREVRHFLHYRARRGLDSPHLLAQAAARGAELGKGRPGSVAVIKGKTVWISETWGEWARVKDRPQPPTEAVWISDFAVRDAIAWGREKENQRSIVWYDHAALGEAIAKASGWPLLGPGMDAEIGALAKSPPSTPIVASAVAHGTGKNLQAWSRQLYTTPSSNGAVWEQRLGRTHRPGQLADEVIAYVFTHTKDLRLAVKRAVGDARFIQETTGQRQKLTFANIAFEFDNEERAAA